MTKYSMLLILCIVNTPCVRCFIFSNAPLPLSRSPVRLDENQNSLASPVLSSLMSGAGGLGHVEADRDGGAEFCRQPADFAVEEGKRASADVRERRIVGGVVVGGRGAMRAIVSGLLW